jgi:putative tryptophan/tyrosine transport system substrate-binding protein
MTYKGAFLAAVLFLVFPSVHAPAQQTTGLPSVGLLWIDAGDSSSYIAALRAGLEAQGYLDGKNVRLDDRFLVARYEDLEGAAAKLASEQVSVIVSYGTTATIAAGKATSSIPIVMHIGSDPVRFGISTSLGKPEKNITGLTYNPGELNAKRVEMLKQTVPAIRRVGMLLVPSSANEVAEFTEAARAVKERGIDLVSVEIHTPGEVDSAISAVKQQNIQALYVMSTTMFVANRRQLIGAISKTRLPAVYANKDFVELGGLLSYGANLGDGFRQVAVFVAKILRGAKPGDLPIEQPTKLELVVNMKTAKALGIKVPHSMVLRADKVIE